MKKHASERRIEDLEILVPFSELLPVDPNDLSNYKDRYFNECDVARIFATNVIAEVDMNNALAG